MHLLTNTGNSLSILIFIRSTKLILIYPYCYRIALDTDLPESPFHTTRYVNTRLRFLSTTTDSAGTSVASLRIGVAVSDFKAYMNAEDVYPRNCK